MQLMHLVVGIIKCLGTFGDVGIFSLHPEKIFMFLVMVELL